MGIVLILSVAITTIIVFVFGFFIGTKKASKELSDKLYSAWSELNRTNKDYMKLINKLNKMK